MKNTIRFQLNSLVIIVCLVLVGCTDSVAPENLVATDQDYEETPDQIIQTSNYVFSIFESSEGDLFSIRRLDQSLVASNISKDELISSYPEIFDELILDGMSNGLDDRIYYDDQNMNRIRNPN